jgi:hypothetical protein
VATGLYVYDDSGTATAARVRYLLTVLHWSCTSESGERVDEAGAWANKGGATRNANTIAGRANMAKLRSEGDLTTLECRARSDWAQGAGRRSCSLDLPLTPRREKNPISWQGPHSSLRFLLLALRFVLLGLRGLVHYSNYRTGLRVDVHFVDAALARRLHVE